MEIIKLLLFWHQALSEKNILYVIIIYYDNNIYMSYFFPTSTRCTCSYVFYEKEFDWEVLFATNTSLFDLSHSSVTHSEAAMQIDINKDKSKM